MTKPQIIWNKTIQALAERNESVEVVLVSQGDEHRLPSAPDADVQPCRMRVLSSEPNGEMILQRSNASEPAAEMNRGAIVEVLLSDNGQRWRAVSEVLEGFYYKLNAQQRIRAVRLSPPHDIQSAQRRAFFRADMLGADLDMVLLEPVESTPSDATGAEREEIDLRLKARLVNISGGGLGVNVPVRREIVTLIRENRQYRCRINLPEIDESIDVRVQLIHLRRPTPQVLYLGLEFRFDDSAQRKRTEDLIVRFTTWMQRRQIRRARRA